MSIKNIEENKLLLKMIDTPIYAIYSKHTQYFYIDHLKTGYFFFNHQEAQKFLNAQYDDYYSKRINNIKDIQKFINELFDNGFAEIQIINNNSEKMKYSVIRLFEDDKQFHNNMTNGNILRLRQKKDKECLQQLYKANFIIPAKILQRNKRHPYVNYVIATKKNDKKKYLPIFTDLKEFNKWNKKNEWEALMLPMFKIKNISEKDGIVINPSSKAIILSKNNFKYISKN